MSKPLTAETNVSLKASEWWKIVGGVCSATALVVSFVLMLKYDVRTAAAQAVTASEKADKAAVEVREMKEDLNDTFTKLLTEVGELKGYVAGMADAKKATIRENDGK